MLSNQIKLQAFKAIVSTPSFLGKLEDHDGILIFLNRIWNLKEMPSQDDRYKNAYDDAHKHVVNNNDWTMDYLFLERFKLIDGDEKYFEVFLESVVNPTVRKTKGEILAYVAKINSIIQPTGYKMILTDYFEELPVYRYRNSSEISDLPIDIIPNQIPIYLSTSKLPNEFPSFVLSYDNWNDYGYYTLFNLTYRKEMGRYNGVGAVKLMKRGIGSTSDVLPEKFTELSNEYCSLGQSKEYYKELKDILGGNFSSFLLSLRDVAIFPKINEQFESDEIYTTSIIRDNSVERLTRTIRFEIEGINPNEYYKFNFQHQPPYAENSINLNFDFEYHTDFEHRIYALIGKNGAGKTRILSALAKNLAEKEPRNFSPRKPIYGKVFSVSYSYFDKFEIPASDASFNYVYCGLKKVDGTLKSEAELLERFYITANIIVEKEEKDYRFQSWIAILANFLPNEILEQIRFKKIVVDETTTANIFNVEEFEMVKMKLSSGQSILLYMVTEILSQIRYDSLILFDEPETHLHPNAISALLNTMFGLVKKFQSFCIIATHSPLIIQEIPARNIFVVEREDNIAFVRGLERESFGENLTVITQDIFGNRDVPRHFISLISDLISKGKSYNEIISILESDELPITSNIRMYVKTLMLPQ